MGLRLERIISAYLRIASAILILTAVIKVAGSFSRQLILTIPDPLFFFMSRRFVLLCAAGAELLCAAAILRRKNNGQALWALAWLSGIFGVYRVGLRLLDGPGESVCPCLGYWLPLEHSLINQVSTGIFVFLLVGTLIGLGLDYICRKTLPGENTAELSQARNLQYP